VEEKELGRGGKGVVLLVRHVLDGVSLGHFACKRVPVGDDHEWLEKVYFFLFFLFFWRSDRFTCAGGRKNLRGRGFMG
jgi:hypothetical protein